ncbi:MAG: four helix bundle protein, partial [Salinimicrobium sp.]
MEGIKSFEDLNCWKAARKLRIEISDLIKQFPDYEKFELVSQMRRASRSVTHNIAEGYGRF